MAYMRLWVLKKASIFVQWGIHFYRNPKKKNTDSQQRGTPLTMAYDLSAFRHPRLRATDQKYRESDDRSRIKFSYYYFSKICWQFFGELFPKITFIRSAFFSFPNFTKIEKQAKSPLWIRMEHAEIMHLQQTRISNIRNCSRIANYLTFESFLRHLHLFSFLMNSYFQLFFRLIESANREGFKVKVKFSSDLVAYISSIYICVYFSEQRQTSKGSLIICCFFF